MQNDWEVRGFTDEYEQLWDDFIQTRSINGTFLQERRFLNYHPKDRFSDCSLLFFYKGELAAVCPACVAMEGADKVFYSHMGSTYGGLIVCQEVYKTEKLLELIHQLELYLKKNHFMKCILKPAMDLVINHSEDLMEFCLCYNGFEEYRELNSFLNYEQYHDDILCNLSKMKQRIVKKCIKEGLALQELTSRADIEAFHSVLASNLVKYNRVPVHSVDELMDLKYNRVPNETEFWGAFLENKLVAGTMVFLFHKAGCAHTQYLAADPNYNKLSPMSFIYYKMAERYKNSGYKYLSWGITTEGMGRTINMGLTKNKEEFGSQHNLIRIFEKKIEY